MGLINGPIIFYGRCRGGPYNAKQMAHGTKRYRVTVDLNNKKTFPAYCGAEPPDGFAFGFYAFDETRGEWDWIAPETAEPVNK